MKDEHKQDRLSACDPAIALAILIAARRTGNRLLEYVARNDLARAGVQVQLSLAKYPKLKVEGAPDE